MTQLEQRCAVFAVPAKVSRPCWTTAVEFSARPSAMRSMGAGLRGGGGGGAGDGVVMVGCRVS